MIRTIKKPSGWILSGETSYLINHATKYLASEHIAWTTVSFALPGTISETRGLLRVGLGSVAFSAVDIRDIFVGLEALVALWGEGWPWAGRRAWLATSCLWCDRWIWSVWCVLLPEPPHCSAPEEKGRQDGVSLVKAGLNTALGFYQLIRWCFCMYQHLTPDGLNHTEMLRKPELLRFFRIKGKLKSIQACLP